jgi:hypothetical protein
MKNSYNQIHYKKGKTLVKQNVGKIITRIINDCVVVLVNTQAGTLTFSFKSFHFNDLQQYKNNL